MPAEQLPNSIAGSTVRITRAGGSWGASKRLAAVRRVLLVMAAVSSCAGAAFATHGVWRVASTVEALLDLARPVPPRVAPAEVGARVDATVPSLPGEAKSAEPAPLPDIGEGGTSPGASPTTAEASENPISLGGPHWPEYVRTECSGVFVYIVTTSVDSPRDSAASLASSKNGRARLRRPGQMLGDWEVLGITDDWSGLNPAVWLLKGHQVCRAELAGNPARVHVALKPPAKKRKPRRRRRRGKRR